MATRAAALLVFVAVSGCKYGPDAFHCADDTSCGAAGRCEANHACSFPDTTCESGWKYGELGGVDSGKCVGEAPVPDAGVAMIDASSSDVGPDARVCFGSAPFTICLASAPTASLTLATTSPLDTTSSPLCIATVSGATNYCVLAGTVISIEGKLRATGTKPLVLIASDSITVTGTLDVGSHRGVTPETGAGADPASCAPGTGPGFAGGGGAGGSFAGLGGNGGLGGFVNSRGTGGVASAASGTVTTVRGGCPGQDGHGFSDRGLKGHGGGAVFLIAGNKIDVQASAVINAAGEGGGGALSGGFGGGGGGAGGMIGFDAPAITCASGALLLASGGGGGEGAASSGAGSAGSPGADPTTTTAATGGHTQALGGDGGNGSVDAATAGATGGAGDVGSTFGGGGGGGGGAGLIKVLSSDAFCTQLAPPATR